MPCRGWTGKETLCSLPWDPTATIMPVTWIQALAPTPWTMLVVTAVVQALRRVVLAEKRQHRTLEGVGEAKEETTAPENRNE